MKTVQLVSVLLMGCVMGVQAEITNPKVDSLKKLLQSHQPIDKAEVLWNIAYELFDVDNSQAVFYAERAFQEVRTKSDSLQIVKVGTTYGQLLRRVGRVNLSIELSSNLLPIASRNNFVKYQKILLTSLGAAFSFKEDFAKGLEYTYQMMRLNEAQGDSVGIALGLLNIGFVLYKSNDFRMSLKYSREAYRLSNRFSLIDNKTSACFNMASAYAGMDRHDSAQYFYRKSLTLAKELNQRGNLPHFYQSYGQTLYALKDLDSADYYAELAVDQGTVASHLYAVSMAYILRSKIALLKGKPSLSWLMLQKADSVNLKSDYPLARIMFMKQKSQHFGAIGNIIASSIYLEQYHKINDSIYHWREREKTRFLQVEFEQRANKQKLKAQAELMELKNSIITKNQRFIVAVTLLLGFVAILAISLYRSKQREHLINQMLDERVADRTRELLNQRDELVHNREEQRLSKLKIYQDLRSQINSLNGIVHLAAIDRVNEPVEYLNAASKALSKLDESARKLILENK